MRHVFQRIETAVRIGDFEAIAQVPVTNESVVAGSMTIALSTIILITFVLRFAGIRPHAIIAFYQVVRNVARCDLHLFALGALKSKVTRASGSIRGYFARRLRGICRIWWTRNKNSLTRLGQTDPTR